jgi:hypothetical protein
MERTLHVIIARGWVVNSATTPRLMAMANKTTIPPAATMPPMPPPVVAPMSALSPPLRASDRPKNNAMPTLTKNRNAQKTSWYWAGAAGLSAASTTVPYEMPSPPFIAAGVNIKGRKTP